MLRLGKDEIILVEFSCIHQRKNSKVVNLMKKNITHSITTNTTTYKAKHTRQRARKFKKDIRSSIVFSQFRIKIIRRIIDASIKNIKNQFTLTFSKRSYSESQLSIYLRKYNSMLSIDQTDLLILRFNSATRLNLSSNPVGLGSHLCVAARHFCANLLEETRNRRGSRKRVINII